MEVDTILSITALCISIATAWFSLFYRGTVKMTRPGFFAILPRDGFSRRCPKIFIRCLLFSTGKRGHAIENMFVKIRHHSGNVQRFLYWAYGERSQLVPGSGMFVGPEGVESNHHFTQIEESTGYKFEAGKYVVDVVGSIVGSAKAIQLQHIKFEVTNEEAEALKQDKDVAIFYWWDPEKKEYSSRIDRRRGRSRSVSVSGSGNGTFDWE